MRLSILIAGLAWRPWKALTDRLVSQAEGLPVEVLVDVDEGQSTSGQKRQRLFDRAIGDYVVFIDDDDQVSDDYVLQLIAATATSPDLVTFCLQARLRISRPGRRDINRIEMWSFGVDDDDRRSGRMLANHLCCWARRLAARVAWCPDLGYGDDQLWYKTLHATITRPLIHHHVDRVLYTYEFQHWTTANQTPVRLQFSRLYFGPGLRVFRIRDQIFIECGRHEQVDQGLIKTRDAQNKIHMIPDTLDPIATVRLR